MYAIRSYYGAAQQGAAADTVGGAHVLAGIAAGAVGHLADLLLEHVSYNFV